MHLENQILTCFHWHYINKNCIENQHIALGRCSIAVSICYFQAGSGSDKENRRMSESSESGTLTEGSGTDTPQPSPAQ